MKLRLAIAVAPGHSVTFEHAGPVIRIGRDPECELCLEGQASDAVSRQHACIELSSAGATLADTGSSNGTLLNGRKLGKLDRAAPLRVGDRIQMGYTGATLTVVELDLGAAPASAGAWALRPVVVGAVAAAALVAVVVVALGLPRKPDHQDDRAQDKPTATAPDPGPGKPTPTPGPGVRDPGPGKPTPTPGPGVRDPGPGKPTPTPGPGVRDPGPGKPTPTPGPGATGLDPSEVVKEVGGYEVPDKSVSVLLQRQGEEYPWAVLGPKARISSGTTLLSLPGYLSILALDTGIKLTLCGNLPEFATSSGVPESVVMLNVPDADFDLDFTLNRGRVTIANQKPAGKPARVRLHFFQDKVWELVLPDAKAEVGLEIWTIPGNKLSSDLNLEGSVTCLTLFTKEGGVKVTAFTKEGGVKVTAKPPNLPQNLDVKDHECLSWGSREPTMLYLEPLGEFLKNVPDCWWTKKPDDKALKVQKGRRSLLEWCGFLGGANADLEKPNRPTGSPRSVIETVKTQVVEVSVKDPDNQDEGVLILAALDEVEPLLDLLRTPQSNVRGITRTTLQTWLSRGRKHGEYLAELLKRRGSSQETVQRFFKLLLDPYSEKDLEQRKTYEYLVTCLDDDEFLVRDLGLWHLMSLKKNGWLPKETQIDYDPTMNREQRRPAVEQLSKLIRDGKIPARSRR